MVRKQRYTIYDFEKISNLYWDEGYTQSDIGEIFYCDQTTISRIINGKTCNFICKINQVSSILNLNIKPKINEAVQARMMRAKRNQLPSTKLTWNKVSNMRKLYLAGQTTQKELSIMFKVHQSTVSRILRGIKWKELV